MNYARLPDVRNEVNGNGSTSQDGDILRAIAAASDFARELTGRIFHTEVATALFHGNGKECLRLGSYAAEPWRNSLVSVTTLKVDDNNDGVFELTLTEDTDYWLGTDNPGTGDRPAESIEIVTGRNTAPQIYTWPKRRRVIEIVGKWGYSEITEAVVVGGTAVTGTLSSASDLTLVLTLDPGDKVAPGDSLFMGTEEMGPVLDVSGTTVTLQARGINGTTAATQTTVAVLVRQYPDYLSRAVRADAARYLWRAAQGMPDSTDWPMIRDTLHNYRVPVLA